MQENLVVILEARDFSHVRFTLAMQSNILKDIKEFSKRYFKQSIIKEVR